MTLMEWDQREVLDKETPQSNENIAISSIHLCLSVYPLCKATQERTFYNMQLFMGNRKSYPNKTQIMSLNNFEVAVNSCEMAIIKP